MREAMLALLAACTIAATCTCSGAEEIRREFDETFEVSEGVALHLRHGDGDAVLVPWEKDEIRVEVIFHADVRGFGFHDGFDFDVDFRQSGDIVEVVGKEPGMTMVGFFATTYHDYHYTVHAPPYAVLRLSGDDGDVSVEGWRADIECELDDGDLELHDVHCPRVRIMIEDGTVRAEDLACDLKLEGDDGDVSLRRGDLAPCWISVNDGDVFLGGCEGEIGVRVDDGDVSLDDVRSPRIDIRGADGDIDVSLAGDPGFDLDISTDDGDVDVKLAAGLSADFRIDVDDGRIHVELSELLDFVQGEGRASGVIGSGGASIRIRTNDGDVSLREL